MGLGSKLERADRLEAYIGEVTSVIGHADRAGPLRDYCAGLLATDGRRSVEPMAAVTCPGHVSAQHQSLLHFVGNSPTRPAWQRVGLLELPDRHSVGYQHGVAA